MNNLLFRLVLCFISMILIGGCTITPEMIRRQPARDIQSISADQQKVADCISKQLKAVLPSSYDVIDEAGSIQVKYGSVTLRLYDLANAVGGTMLTIYVGSPFHVTESLMVAGHCRKSLETPKLLSELPAK